MHIYQCFIEQIFHLMPSKPQIAELRRLKGTDFKPPDETPTALDKKLLAIAAPLTEGAHSVSLFNRGWLISEGRFKGGGESSTKEEIEKSDIQVYEG